MNENFTTLEATDMLPIKLDARVRPIAPKDNLIGFASVTINDSFVVDGIKVCSGENGLYVNMPSSQDNSGKWHDVCKPITADFRNQLTAAVVEGYGIAIEKMQNTVDAAAKTSDKPSLTGALKQNADMIKAQPAAPTIGKEEQTI